MAEERKLAKKEKKKSDKYKIGKANKRNGRIAENDLYKLLNSWGLECEKIPASGAIKSSHRIGDDLIQLKADLRIKYNDKHWLIEVKRRENSTSFYKLVDRAGAVLIPDFCYIMSQKVFQAMTLGIRPVIDEIPDKGFVALHKFFNQDNADIVAIKKPYCEWVFAIKIHVKEEICK